MMSVFATKLKTTKGRELVRQHCTTFDAQAVYAALYTYSVGSTKADDECQQLNEFLLTADASAWNGSMHDFIVYFKDKVKDYNEKSAVQFQPDQVRTFIEKAVSKVPDLAIIKTQAKQLAKIGHQITLEQYYELLEDAAMSYDIKHGHALPQQPRHSKWHVYTYQTPLEPYSIETHDLYDPPDSNKPFDLDTPVSCSS